MKGEEKKFPSTQNRKPRQRMLTGLSVKGGRRTTFPRVGAVSSSRRGLTSLFGMGRGAPPRHCRLVALPGLGGRGKPTQARGGRFRAEALGPLVPLGSTCRHAPTCGLSTSSSATALKGGLISGRASRLDAFSAYPLRTRLPGRAPGGATGTPLVRPTRSSRTKVRSPQASDARNR